MATYTSANAIKKISTGDESGTWGDSTNNNFDIIDRAANGFVSIALSGTSYTLSLSTTAVLSDGHYKAINFTGTPGGTCTVTLEQNDKARLYMILNSTDQSLSITQGSGANVTIATTKSAIVLADGAGSGAAVTDFTAVIGGISTLDVTAGTVSASKAVVVDSNKDITGFRNVTMTGELDAATLDISGNADIDGTLETDAFSIAGTTVSATAAELNYNDTGAAVGTVVASKTVTADANKDVASLRNLTLTGELDAATLDISGNADIDGTLETDALSLNGTAVTSTAAELNIMDGGTSASTVTVVDADQIVLNDNGTMKQIAVSSLKTYSDGETAWVNFNGTGTVAIRANANISGITDNSTGDYTLAFSTNFSDADYIGTCGAAYVGAGVDLMVHTSDSADGTPTLKSTSEIRVSCVTDSNNFFELEDNYWNFIR
jgi:cytoskeletal protein CcmA (bactofilin family)